MRTEIAKYQNGRLTLRIIGIILVLSVGLIILSADLHDAIKAALFILLVPVVIIAHKKINASVKYLGHFTLSHDQDFLYYTSSYKETKIPLKDITHFIVYFDSDNSTDYQECKIVYDDFMVEKSIRFWVSMRYANQCNDFKKLVESRNPRVNIENDRPDLLFKAQDKVTGALNRISAWIFKSR